MTDIVDRVVAALRTNHDTLSALVRSLQPDDLLRSSGSSEWTVAQVLSHLGSGAEITVKPVQRAAGVAVPEEDNQAVWARWDAAGPAEQAAGYLEHDAAHVAVVEALTPEQRGSLSIDLGFLPEPVPLVVALGMRLNEVANHVWDVRVALDETAEIDDESAAVLLELFAGPMAFLLGFTAKPDQVSEPVRLAVTSGGIVVDDAVAVVGSLDDPTATLVGPAGAAVRLLTGRLREPYAAGVAVEGDVTLEDLRRVFPGY